MKVKNCFNVKETLKNLEPFEKYNEVLDLIFGIALNKENKSYSVEVISEYEKEYLEFIKELLRESIEDIFFEEDWDEIEDSMLIQYNPDNLVCMIKKIENGELK